MMSLISEICCSVYILYEMYGKVFYEKFYFINMVYTYHDMN